MAPWRIRPKSWHFAGKPRRAFRYKSKGWTKRYADPWGFSVCPLPQWRGCASGTGPLAVHVADVRRIELRDELQPLTHRELLQAVFDT